MISVLVLFLIAPLILPLQDAIPMRQDAICPTVSYDDAYASDSNWMKYLP